MTEPDRGHGESSRITDRDRAVRLARKALRLSIDGQVLVLGAILGAEAALAAVAPPSAKASQREAILRYRLRFHAALSGNQAARAVDCELRRFEATAWLGLRRLNTLPPGTPEKRRALFEILKFGSPPRIEGLRKILHASGKNFRGC